MKRYFCFLFVANDFFFRVFSFALLSCSWLHASVSFVHCRDWYRWTAIAVRFNIIIKTAYIWVGVKICSYFVFNFRKWSIANSVGCNVNASRTLVPIIAALQWKSIFENKWPLKHREFIIFLFFRFFFFFCVDYSEEAKSVEYLKRNQQFSGDFHSISFLVWKFSISFHSLGHFNSLFRVIFGSTAAFFFESILHSRKIHAEITQTCDINVDTCIWCRFFVSFLSLLTIFHFCFFFSLRTIFPFWPFWLCVRTRNV